MKYLIFSFLFLSLNVSGTVYFTAFDKVSGTTALVYSSSGGNFWQTLVKGKGMIGAQSYGLCHEATPEIFLNQNLSAEQLIFELSTQCTQVNWHNYRLSVVTIDGQMSSHIASNGCHDGNVFCGSEKGEEFLITGGGLEEQTLKMTRDYYNSLPKKISFTCRLYKTLVKAYEVGGELKEFRGASITMDNPAWDNFFDIRHKRKWNEPENVLLENLSIQLKEKGFDCL